MIPLRVVGDIEYGLLQSPEADSMVRLLAEVFSLYDPPAVAVGLSIDEIQSFLPAFVPKALSERLTLVARDRITGDLVGALLTDDFGTPTPDGLDLLAPTFAPIGALLDSLDTSYRATRDIAAGTHLHLFMLGVARSASGRGIAHQLISSCLENGEHRGYRTAVTEATGRVSQHVFRKLGFNDVLSAPYKSFQFNGQAVFASISSAEATILMERSI